MGKQADVGGGGLDGWVWAKHQDHLPAVLTIMVLAINSVSVTVPAIAAGAFFLGLSRGEAALWLLSADLVGALGFLAGFWLLRRELEPLRRWSAGDRSDPSALLTAMLRIPHLLGTRFFASVLGAELLLCYPYALWLSRPDWPGAIAMFLAYVLVVLVAASVGSTTVQLLTRAAVVDLGDSVGPVITPHVRWWTLRWRFVLTMAAFCALAGVVTTSVVLGTSAGTDDYLVATVAGIGYGIYVGAAVLLIFLGPVLSPLDEVIRGTTRVRSGDFTRAVPVLAADELGDLAVAFNEMQTGLRERESLHAAFGSYVDPALAQRLLDSGSSMFDGEELEVTVLFADVRDFTSYSERVDPREAVALLNRLFDVMVPVLHEHGGHANHYLGDGLLAIFGAPNPLVAHADAAVAAAVDIQRAVRAEFGSTLHLGVGINTGPVIAGTVGGGGRHEFTVIGDTVNLAARVEQLTKETGDLILITDATRVASSAPRPRPTKRGLFDVRGKTTRVTLYGVNPFPRSTR